MSFYILVTAVNSKSSHHVVKSVLAWVYHCTGSKCWQGLLQSGLWGQAGADLCGTQMVPATPVDPSQGGASGKVFKKQQCERNKLAETKVGRKSAPGAGGEVSLQCLEKITEEQVGFCWRNCAYREPALEQLVRLELGRKAHAGVSLSWRTAVVGPHTEAGNNVRRKEWQRGSAMDWPQAPFPPCSSLQLWVGHHGGSQEWSWGEKGG